MQLLSPPAAPLGMPPAVSTALGGTRTRGGRQIWPSFYLNHLWMPLAASVVLSLWLMGLHGDLWIADRLYAWEGHTWALQAAHITQDLLHAEGRELSKGLWFVLLLLLVATVVTNRGRRWRWPLGYLLLATSVSTAAVGMLKRWTNVDCPWDLLRYGGGNAYYGLFSHRPTTLVHAKCFPAGHASAGYAWVALYFVFLNAQPRWRWWGLGFGLAAGLVFGIAQQLRGAHFLSHDLWALMVCWLVALALHSLMLTGNARGLAKA